MDHPTSFSVHCVQILCQVSFHASFGANCSFSSLNNGVRIETRQGGMAHSASPVLTNFIRSQMRGCAFVKESRYTGTGTPCICLRMTPADSMTCRLASSIE